MPPEHEQGGIAMTEATARQVGGAIRQAELPLHNKFARVPFSGLIAQYNGVGKGDDTDRLPATMRQILSKSLTVRGFMNHVSPNTTPHSCEMAVQASRHAATAME